MLRMSLLSYGWIETKGPKNSQDDTPICSLFSISFLILCPPSIFHTLKVQSNQLKVIESTPTITFGITVNTNDLNLIALYVPWGRPFCRTPPELPKPFNLSFSSTPQASSGLHLSASELETRVIFPSIRDEFQDSDSGKFASLFQWLNNYTRTRWGRRWWYPSFYFWIWIWATLRNRIQWLNGGWGGYHRGPNRKTK